MSLENTFKKTKRTAEKTVLKSRQWWRDTGKDTTKALVNAGIEKGKERISRIGDVEAQYMERHIGKVPKQDDLKNERNILLDTLVSDPAHPLNDIEEVRSDSDFHAVGYRGSEGNNPHLQVYDYDIKSDGTPYGTPIDTIEHFTPSDATDTIIPPAYYFTTLKQLKVYMGRLLLRTRTTGTMPTISELDTQFGNKHKGYDRVLDAFEKRMHTAREMQRHSDARALNSRMSNPNDASKVPQYYPEMSADEVQMLMGIMKMPMKPRSLWWRLLHTLSK